MRCRALSLVVVALAALLALAGASPAGAAGAVRPAQPRVWPLAGQPVVVRPFDPPITRYGAGHRGADLAGRPDQVVMSAAAGRVTYAGLLAGRGVVVVSSGPVRWTYEPVQATVRVGQLVAAGDPLGRLTSGHGGCPGTCLHWGLLRGDVYLDPVRWLQGGPSRLLPLDQPELAQQPAGVGSSALTTSSGEEAAAAPAVPPPAPRPAPRRAVRPATAPAFALRSADRAWAGIAVLALLCGLALLRRPGQPPPEAPATAGVLLTPEALPGSPVCAVSGVVDLTSERVRRRTGVA